MPLIVPTDWFVPVTERPPPLAVEPLLLMFTNWPSAGLIADPSDRAETVPANCNVAAGAMVAVTPDWTVAAPLATLNCRVPEFTTSWLFFANDGAAATISVPPLTVVPPL